MQYQVVVIDNGGSTVKAGLISNTDPAVFVTGAIFDMKSNAKHYSSYSKVTP